MTDMTPHFHVCLRHKGVQAVVKREYDIKQINSFLQEAYSINARIADLRRELGSIRPAYLSTAPPHRRRNDSQQHARSRPLTDAEREEFDAQSKGLLRQLNGAITNLKQAEEIRNQTAESVALSKRAKGGLGRLGRWATGGAVTAKLPEEEREEAEREAIRVCRENVIAYLLRKLEEAGRLQTEMMDARLSRRVEKSKSVLYKSRMGGEIPYAHDEDAPRPISPISNRTQQITAMTAGETPYTINSQPSQELSQEQQQLFAQENDQLLQHFNTQLEAISQAEKSILEISQLQSTLMANIELQSENISQLVEDSYLTTENLGKGNKELKRASERRSTAQGIFYATAAFCSFLVVWDLIF